MLLTPGQLSSLVWWSRLGDAHFTERTHGSTLFVNPFMAGYVTFVGPSRRPGRR